MPTVRDALMDAAFAALGERPWEAVRMAEVAAAAGVSRQTLYNEFSSKDGLARALARREADAFLAGVDRCLATARRAGADAGECFAAAAGWTLRSARRSPLIRAALTQTPPPGPPAAEPPRSHTRTAQEAGRGTGSPLVDAMHARTVEALVRGYPRLRPEDIGWACEAALRLTLSYVIAPAADDRESCLRIAQLVRSLLSWPAGPSARPVP
ncbi:TetR/AcrR family transcriptional regulator [Actinacidiphila bryophytorum]|uniref:TetR/AcrR family transcriptional regulator n=1 Tax=Actinacidiphila bryophytorum TaxID=1436133 RepID=UPI002176E236|nr:TetR/AcrR family transcriptional regulator [Actinacidiphila bryophytorum]UWE12336.1 TetR/AcrR family transcriptional regulator [Actinacidiphila bryophytorum]